MANSKEAQDAFNAGLTAFWAGDFEAANEQFHHVLHYDSAYPEVYYYMGIICYKQGLPRGAINYLTTAIRLKPDHPDAYFSRAVIHMDRDELDEAMADLQQVIVLGGELVDEAQVRLEEVRARLGL